MRDGKSSSSLHADRFHLGCSGNVAAHDVVCVSDRLWRGETSVDVDERLTSGSRGLSHHFSGENGVTTVAVSIHHAAIEAADRADQTRCSGFEIAPQTVAEADIALAAVLPGKLERQIAMLDPQNIPAERPTAENGVVRTGRSIDANQHAGRSRRQ